MQAIPVLTLAALASCCVAKAQAQDAKPQKVRSFFPRDYTNEYFLDLDALQDSDFWSLVERSLLARPAFQAFRKEFGFRVTDLATMRGTMVEVGEADARRPLEVHVYKGLERLKLPAPETVGRSKHRHRSAIRFHGKDAIQEGSDDLEELRGAHFRPKVYVLPDPKTLVFGDKSHLSEILAGKVRGGVPHPDLIALTAFKRPIGYMALKWSDKNPVPEGWLVETDLPQSAVAKVEIVGEEKHLVVCMRARFQTGKRGPAQVRDLGKKALADLVSDKRFAKLQPLIEKLKISIDGTDLVVTLDLGDPKAVSKALNTVGAIVAALAG